VKTKADEGEKTRKDDGMSLESQVDANGRPLFFSPLFSYSPPPSRHCPYERGPPVHQLTLSAALDRPCSKFEPSNAERARLRGMQRSSLSKARADEGERWEGGTAKGRPKEEEEGRGNRARTRQS